MKTTTCVVYLFCGIVRLFAVPMDWTDDDRRLENEQVAFWETLLTEANLKPKQALFEDLWLGFRKMGHRKTWDGHNPKVDAVYEALQNEFLSLPGHAEYFRDKVENDRATILPKETYGGTYDFNRILAFEALTHLPSPETIKVLGEYLNDERDAAKEPLWTSDYILMGTGPNSYYAGKALQNIGLRNADFAQPDTGKEPSRNSSEPDVIEKYMQELFSFSVLQREAQLKPWRAWYAEVKSGQRTFSFKGQNGDYRFKPDGTWETLAMDNPPDDGPRPTKPINTNGQRPDKKQNPSVAPQELKPLGNSLPWIVGAIVFLISGAAWVAVRNVFSNSR